MTIRRPPPPDTPPRTEVLTARVTPADIARIDIAARLHGVTRHRYAAQAAVRAAERDIARLTAGADAGRP